MRLKLYQSQDHTSTKSEKVEVLYISGVLPNPKTICLSVVVNTKFVRNGKKYLRHRLRTIRNNLQLFLDRDSDNDR